MPCYRCGTRQGDPEPGKGSPWRRGVISEHQVLICPACQPAVLAELARCPGCGSAHLIRRLDQVECLDCRRQGTPTRIPDYRALKPRPIAIFRTFRLCHAPTPPRSGIPG